MVHVELVRDVIISTSPPPVNTSNGIIIDRPGKYTHYHISFTNGGGGHYGGEMRRPGRSKEEAQNIIIFGSINRRRSWANS